MSESDCIGEFLEKYKSLQVEFLNYIESEKNSEYNFMFLTKLFEKSHIKECAHDVRLFLRLVLKVANNHHRGPNFFDKIEKVLQYFKYDIKKYPNSEIFTIFESNKRILLFLIEEKILTVDEYFVKQIIKKKYIEEFYPHYFEPEIKPFFNKKWFPKYDKENYKTAWVKKINKELPDNFYELRKIGENESFVCKLIREDAVEEFIINVNKNIISCDEKICPSIFETNSFLIKYIYFYDQIFLQQYAAFFGSIQILNYLKNSNVNLTPSLWLYAIHSKNAELIHFLEDNHIELFNSEIIIEKMIECHHNDFANYFLDNYLQNNNENSNYVLINSLRYYNFLFLQNELINKSLFKDLCCHDYYSIVKEILKSKNVDINDKTIQNSIFFFNCIKNHII